jgi:hypothetical protein
MSISSWVGSVWSLRGVEGPVIGQVRAVEGDLLTMAVVGIGGQALEGVEILPSREGSGQFARVSSECLLGNWKRMGGVPA